MALARIAAYDPTGPHDLAAFAAGSAAPSSAPRTRPTTRPARSTTPRSTCGRSASSRRRRPPTWRGPSSFARETGLELAVRGGAHSLAGYGTTEGGIVLDLGLMKGLHIDPVRRLAWAQAGLRAGEYTAAAAEHGLATPFGDTGSVGIAGLTLGGGIGWLVRKYGLTIDALVSVEIVTADGRIVVASETEHPDLFWAVRGGGGNFGVVTRFQFRLYPVGMILGGALFLPPTREVLRGLESAADERARGALDDLVPHAAPRRPRSSPRPSTASRPSRSCSSTTATRSRARRPWRRSASWPRRWRSSSCRCPTWASTRCSPRPRSGRRHPTARCSSTRSMTTRSTRSSSAMADPSSPAAMTQIRILGGAMARVGADETAFAHRDANGHGRDHHAVRAPAEAPVHAAWTQAYYEALRPRLDRCLLELPRGRGRDPHPRGLSRGDLPSAWPTSSAGTTRPTCSASTRTSRPHRWPDPYAPPDAGSRARVGVRYFAGSVRPKAMARPTHSSSAASSATTSAGNVA